MLLFQLLLIATLWSLGSYADGFGSDLIRNGAACEKHVAQLVKNYEELKNLTEDQHHFLTQMASVFGRRILQSDPESVRTCTDGHCLAFRDFDFDDGQRTPRNLRVEFVDTENPKIEIVKERGLKTLKVPKNFRFESEEDARAHFMALAMGHPLHPFMASKTTQKERTALGEERFFLKPAQVEAGKAVEHGIEMAEKNPEAENRRILVVAPTGTGKTKILESFLTKIVPNSQKEGKKLHFVTAHTDDLVNQLRDDIDDFGNKGKDFTVIRWPSKKGPQSIDKLVEFIEQNDKPVIVVGTIQTVNARMSGGVRLGQNPTDKTIQKRVRTVNENAKKLIPHLGSFTQDEAHHSNAPLTKDVIKALIDDKDSRAFLYGTTATPFHHESGLIEGLYGGRAFWAYLDSAQQFKESGGSVERDLDEVVEQLSRAIKAGELTPFRRTYFMLPEDFTKNADFYGVGNRINAKYFPQLIDRLKPRFRERSRGFISVGSVDEANELAKALNDAEMTPKRTFAAFHSDLHQKDQDQIMKDFKAGKINYLVTIRKLDEGIDVPDISLYIDLNKTIGPRQFLQRVGRVLRLAPNKESIDVVTMMAVDEANIRENIKLLSAIKDGRLRSDADIRDVDAEGKPTEEEENTRDAHQMIEKIEKELREKEFWNSHRPTLTLAKDLIAWAKTRPDINRAPLPGGQKTRDVLSSEFRKQHETFEEKINEDNRRKWVKTQFENEAPLGQKVTAYALKTRKNKGDRKILIDALKDHPDLQKNIEEALNARDKAEETRTERKNLPGRLIGRAFKDWMKDANVVRIPTAEEAPELRADLERVNSDDALRKEFMMEFHSSQLAMDVKDLGSNLDVAFRYEAAESQVEKDVIILTHTSEKSNSRKLDELTNLAGKAKARALKSPQTLDKLSDVALIYIGIPEALNTSKSAVAQHIAYIETLLGKLPEELPEDTPYRRMVAKATKREIAHAEFHVELEKKFGKRAQFFGRFNQAASAIEMSMPKISDFVRKNAALPDPKSQSGMEREAAKFLEKEFPKAADNPWASRDNLGRSLAERLYGEANTQVSEFLAEHNRIPSQADPAEKSLALFVRAAAEDPKIGTRFRNGLLRSEQEIYDNWVKNGMPEDTQKPGVDYSRFENMSIEEIQGEGLLQKAQKDSEFATGIINQYYETHTTKPRMVKGSPFEKLVSAAQVSHPLNELELSKKARSAIDLQ